MPDYTFVVGENDPYGFAASDDAAAILHASDYLRARAGEPRQIKADLPVMLSGPDGLLTDREEQIAQFQSRVPLHPPSPTDDIRAGDPTPPDCNMA